MTPTAAARAQHTTATLRDRLKDPSLLKEACYIDGAWVGTPVFAVNNPATGVEIAKVPQLGADDTTKAVEAAGEVAKEVPAGAVKTSKRTSAKVARATKGKGKATGLSVKTDRGATRRPVRGQPRWFPIRTMSP